MQIHKFLMRLSARFGLLTCYFAEFENILIGSKWLLEVYINLHALRLGNKPKLSANDKEMTHTHILAFYWQLE